MTTRNSWVQAGGGLTVLVLMVCAIAWIANPFAGTDKVLPVSLDPDDDVVIASAVEGLPRHGRLAPDEWLMLRRLHNGPPTKQQEQRATLQRETLLTKAQQRQNNNSLLFNDTWTDEGPHNIGGRVLDLVWHPTSTATFYVATASGGLWKTQDDGATFNSVWPQQFAQAIGSVALDDLGNVYVGVGEGAPSGNNPTHGEKGVFVSTDDGSSWTSLGLSNSFRIGRVRIDPTDRTRLFVAASGPIWEGGGERGIYRSTNSGSTWELVLAGANDTSGGAEVIIDPNNPMRLYAVMWDHIRAASFRRLGGIGSGVFRSDNGGDTWSRLAGGLPAQSADVGRIGLAMSELNPQRLYATYIDATGFFTGFHTSVDGGDNWVTQPFNQTLSNSQSSFGWWFGRSWVDPGNVQRVFVAGVPLMRTENAGSSWSSNFNAGHVDQHAMAWHPTIANKVILGNDGGVYMSQSSNGTSWVALGGQPFTQFYTVALSQNTDGRILGGTQDNNCIRNYPGADPATWNAIGCGDGLEVLINYLDDSELFACSQRGNCRRYTNGGSSSSYSIGPLGTRQGWKTPLVFDPNDPAILYYAAERLYKSTNSGANFSAISPDLTSGDPVPGDNYTFGTLSTIAPSKSNSDVIYAGADDGNVWRTRNGGGTWISIQSPQLPDRWVSKMAVDETDADHVFVTFNGYHAADYAPYIFESFNGGDTWQDITSNLPQAPVNSIVIDEFDRLYIASDLGVYYKFGQQTDWSMVGTNLPTAPAMEVQIQRNATRLYAATFGRGMWSIPVPLNNQDTDSIPDELDNCVLLANEAQIDTDNDGFGNQCDADFNNDCTINFGDVAQFAANFQGSDAEFDLNLDGAINFADLFILQQNFLGAPGPSGVTTACGMSHRLVM